MKILLKVITFMVLMASALPAVAICTPAFANTQPSLGTQTSFNVNTTSFTVQDTFTLNCGTVLLSLLGSDNFTMSLNSATVTAAGRPTLSQGTTDAIPLRVYACNEPTCASNTELTIGGTPVSYTAAKLLALNLGVGGNVTFTVPVNITTVPGAVVAAGTYTVGLTIGLTWRVCTDGVAVGTTCVLGTIQQGNTTITLTTQMIVTRDCTTLTTQPITFGTAPLVSSFTTFSGNITVICTKGSTYTVGITNGQHAAGNQRNMINGSTLLAYQIYKGTGTTYWGPTGTDRQSSTGIAANPDFITRVFPFNARILTTQNTPAAGTYTDTVSVDVSF